MTTPNSCQKITLGEAMDRLPDPQGERSVGLFEHGSLVVKLYAPRGHDLQTPHSRDEVYVVAQGSGEFVCAGAPQALCFRPLRGFWKGKSILTCRPSPQPSPKGRGRRQ
jgi:hypothetical protein